MSTRNRIHKILSPRAMAVKKPMSISLNADDIDMVSKLSAYFSSQTGKSFSKSQVVEEAVQAFIESSAKYIQEEKGIDIYEKTLDELQAVRQQTRTGTATLDTVVVPAKDNSDYHRAWFEAHSWANVRILESKLRKMKYISVYLGAPTSGIEYYAEITSYHKDIDNPGRYVINFSVPTKLPRIIEPQESVEAAGMRSVRYTNINLLQNAITLSELFSAMAEN